MNAQHFSKLMFPESNMENNSILIGGKNMANHLNNIPSHFYVVQIDIKAKSGNSKITYFLE